MEIVTNDFNHSKEILKCKFSALYFIENYIKISVPGGYITQKKSDLWNATPKYKRLVKMFQSSNVNNILFQSSRQHGKTTTIAQIMLHQLLFYPGLKIEMLTLTKKNAEDTVERIKFMYSNLPDWLRITKYKGKSDYKTYIEFQNGSKFSTRYISGNISPDTIARGMSVPVLWVDEAAFIPHMEDAWTAAQPAITAARKFALKNGYPSKIIMTTTPNGAGENFFYKMWINAWDYDDIWDFKKENPVKNAQEIINSSDSKNNFAKIKIHWSETGKDEAWYNQQVRELNFNMRRINQELNLVFLGSATAIIDDEVLSKFKVQDPVNKIDIGYGNFFSLYKKIEECLEENPEEVFILGVDTAVSNAATSDFSAMVLTRGSTGEQIGEWHGKITVLKRYAVILKKLIRSLINEFYLDEDNLKVIIERNSIGLAIIEELIYDDTFDFNSFLFKTEIRKGEKAPGIATKKDTREHMFDLLLSLLNENPEIASGILLQEELRNLEQKSSGRIEAGKGAHDDVVMAYNFTLFIRDLLIKSGAISLKNSVKKFKPDIIKSDISVAFNSLNGFETDEDKLKKNLGIDDQFEIVQEFAEGYSAKDYEKYKKQLIKELKPIVPKEIENDNEIGYDVLMF